MRHFEGLGTFCVALSALAAFMGLGIFTVLAGITLFFKADLERTSIYLMGILWCLLYLDWSAHFLLALEETDNR